MTRLTIPDRSSADLAAQPLFDAIERQLGAVPNLYRLIGLSPATLEGVLAFSQALGQTLDVQTRERIALAVAQVNGCDYCLSAHSYLAVNVAGLDQAEIAAARRGRSGDSRANAAVAFARKIVEAHGRITDADLAEIRLADFSDGQIVEIVANVAINVLTNLLGIVADTDIDFPVVRAEAA
jgi:uncharacterized peroxidase-related enzyme